MKKLLLTLVFLAVSITCFEHPLKSIPLTPTITTTTKDSLIRFTPYNLQQYILEKKIRHPQIVYAQAVVETGEFSSRIFLRNNNLFGMKYVKDLRNKRPTTAIGARYGHAVYTDWKKSVDDYLLWQEMFKKTPTGREDQYFALLRKRYAEDKRYVSMLKTVIQNDTTRWLTSNSSTLTTPFTDLK